jgi:hypothetical protein
MASSMLHVTICWVEESWRWNQGLSVMAKDQFLTFLKPCLFHFGVLSDTLWVISKVFFATKWV